MWHAGPVWTTLYILMGTAAWMVWTHGGFEMQKLPLTLYGIQLLFNLAWNPLFFLFHNLDLAFWDALGERSMLTFHFIVCQDLRKQHVPHAVSELQKQALKCIAGCTNHTYLKGEKMQVRLEHTVCTH